MLAILPASELSEFLKQIPNPNPELLNPNPWGPRKGMHWILKTIDLHSGSNICVPVGHYILLLTFLTFCQSHKELESSTSRSRSGVKCSRPLKWFSYCLYGYYASIVTVSLCSARAKSWNTLSSYCAFILARLKEFPLQKPHTPFNSVQWFSEWSPGKKHQYYLGTSWKCRVSPNLSPEWCINSLLDDSDAWWSLRTADPSFLACDRKIIIHAS